jgi:hypothetical protein
MKSRDIENNYTKLKESKVYSSWAD